MAEELLSEAEQFALDSGEEFWIVGLTRLRGSLALAHGKEDAGICQFEKAVSLALERGHFGPLLRAVRELAELGPTPEYLSKVAEAAEVAIGDAQADIPALIEAHAILQKLTTAMTESSSQEN